MVGFAPMPGNATVQRNIKVDRSIIFRSVMVQILVSPAGL
jgi:hypothetical protein